MKMTRRFGIILVSALLLTACADSKPQENVVEITESDLNAPQTTTVVRGDLQAAVYYDAQIGPKTEQLSFKNDGTFGEFKVQLGDVVKKGDVLAVPALENLEEEIEGKTDELASLQANYEHDKNALENRIAIVKYRLEEDYSKLKTLEYPDPKYSELCLQAGNHDEERKRLELSLKQLEETYQLNKAHCESRLQKLQKEKNGNLITAPFDGVVVAVAEAVYGDSIDTNRYYIALGDTSVQYARCEYAGAYFLKSAEKILFWRDGAEYEAVPVSRDDRYYMELKNNGETIFSEFEVTDTQGALSEGDYGKIKVVMKEKKNVLLLPEICLNSSGGEYYVYKDVDGSHERVAVQVGSKDGLNAEITGGLEEGDVVYVQE